MKKLTQSILTAFAATVLLPVSTMAFGGAIAHEGYLGAGPVSNQVVSGAGLCWRTGEWTSSLSSEPCDAGKPLAAAPIAKAVTVAAVTEPVQPISHKVSFSGDALFAFDESVLRPEGRTMLDGLVRQLDGATYDSIVATGHTDRIGSSAYNQRLSERRALAVKEYLISKNVQANRIDAQGLGESQPVTKAGECIGAKSARVVACLQPDRRVDIELTGAKTIVGSL